MPETPAASTKAATKPFTIETLFMTAPLKVG
jgi:hypothetical protein